MMLLGALGHSQRLLHVERAIAGFRVVVLDVGTFLSHLTRVELGVMLLSCLAGTAVDVD
jgi:hypothetical protein